MAVFSLSAVLGLPISAAALTSEYHLALTVGAGLIAAAIVLSAMVLRDPGPAVNVTTEADPAAVEAD